MAPADSGRNVEPGNLRGTTIRDISQSRERVAKMALSGYSLGLAREIFRSRTATLFRTGNCAQLSRVGQKDTIANDISLLKTLERNGDTR